MSIPDNQIEDDRQYLPDDWDGTPSEYEKHLREIKERIYWEKWDE